MDSTSQQDSQGFHQGRQVDFALADIGFGFLALLVAGVPGMYAAGTISHSLDFRKSAGGRVGPGVR
jgi:hypothetical protein